MTTVPFRPSSHPALRARRLARANAWRQWRAAPAEATLHVVAVLVLAIVVAAVAARTAQASLATLAALVLRFDLAIALAAAALATRAATAQVRHWRRERADDVFAALPITDVATRRAGDATLWRRVASWCAVVVFAGAAMRVATPADGLPRATSIVVAAIVVGAALGRAWGWRRALPPPHARVASVHAASTRGATSPAATPHVAAWQRAAGLDVGVARRTVLTLGALLLSVPGGTSLRTGALLLAAFVAMLATMSALSGALAVIAPLAALTRATPWRVDALLAATWRVPAAVVAIGAVATAVLASALGLPAAIALALAAALVGYGAHRLAATWRHRHAPSRIAWRVGASWLVAISLAQLLPPLGALWLAGDAIALVVATRRGDR